VTLSVAILLILAVLGLCWTAWSRANTRLGKRLRLLEMQLRLEAAWQTLRPPDLLGKPARGRLPISPLAPGGRPNKSVNKPRFAAIYKGTPR
jgi:hypothetical protein